MLKITPAIRRMIGNHGEPLDLIRPTASNGYAILLGWENPDETTIEIFAIIDHSGWKRELAKMEVKQIELDFDPSPWFRGVGRATASLTFEHGPAHVPGLLIRIENKTAGTFYLTAEFGPGYRVDPETGERTLSPGLMFVDQGDTLTGNYALKSHEAYPEPYFPCEDIHFAYGEDYFG